MSLVLPAQNLPITKFHRLNVDNGLSNNLVYNIVQDQQGFIWIATQHGLQRFDGQQFTLFLHDPSESNSMGGNDIRFLEIDKSGHLLIGYNDNKVLDKYDPASGIFTHQKLDSDLLQGLLTEAGDLWLWNLSGLQYKAKEDESFAIYNFSEHPKHRKDEAVRVKVIFEDQNKVIWVATSGGGLYEIGKNATAGTWWLPCDERYISVDTTFSVNDVLKDKKGNFWLATDEGLFTKSNTEECLIPYRAPTDQSLPFDRVEISSLSLDGKNQLWMPTFNDGLYILNLNTFQAKYISPINEENEASLSSIYNSFIDQSGNVWLMSNMNGIHFLHPENQQFQWYRNWTAASGELINESLHMVIEDSKGALWLSGDKIEVESNIYPALSKTVLASIGESYAVSEAPGGIFWFSTLKGVKRLDTNTGNIRTYFQNFQSLGTQPEANIVTAEWVDSKGNFWAGFWGGALVYFDENDLDNPQLFPCQELNIDSPLGCFIQCITEGKDGRIWIGSRLRGLTVYDPRNGSFQNFRSSNEHDNGLGHNYVRCILEDDEGILWLGTYGGGMYRFDPGTEQFRHYGTKEGLSGDLIEELRKDNNGYIWITTYTALSRFDPASETFLNFDHEDGLPKAKFERLSTIGPLSGQMYFATSKGFVAFHPDSISIDTTPPTTAIVKMSRYRSNMPGGKPIEEKGISYKEEIILSYEDYIVTFEFAGITFNKAEQTIIEYKLEGFQNDWIRLEDSRQASFTSLSPGDYTLLVKSANAYGIWDKTPVKLKIKVLPPWWKTWWAFCFYIFVAGASILFFWKREARRIKLQSQLEKEQLEAAQLRELDQTKTRFFSNISHEFRTPLTVILGMSEEIEKPNLAKQMIQQSGQNLLRLVNQMLDFSKMDAGKLTLHIQSGDLVHYLQYLLESFQSLAEHKGVQLFFEPEMTSLEVDFDEEKIQHIVSNLLSNAIKFTPRGGQVKLRLTADGGRQTGRDASSTVISVSDTGIGISKDQLPRIFERYFQVENEMSKGEPGSGIGLAFTKELVDLMKGEIEVESEVGTGTVFTVSLPLTSAEGGGTAPSQWSNPSTKSVEMDSWVISPQTIEADSKGAFSTPAEGGRGRLLVIEDNPEVVTYIRTILQNEYDITVAENGQIGIEMAVEQIPDIIISDVMMPVKDGFAVTDFLKNDERTSHIPIVLLTAKADAESRLAGLERGADAYLAKPFDKKELKLRLEKLVELRQKLQARYAQFVPPAPSEEKEVLIEDAFLTKINNIIEANLAEAEFGVNELCRVANLSQSQLFRKLKALTGKSSVAYIRSLRLHRAKNLLEKGALNVSEVAYSTGFNDPLYFSRVFSQEFGYPPTDLYK
jgi:signal transduction histidine kinase/DNA-binding response OmpR family regulator/streptogramin lyase